MFCKQCGNEIEPGVSFCTECGAQLGTPSVAGPAEMPEKRGGKKKIVLLACTVVVVVAAAVAACVLLLGGGKGSVQGVTPGVYDAVMTVVDKYWGEGVQNDLVKQYKQSYYDGTASDAVTDLFSGISTDLKPAMDLVETDEDRTFVLSCVNVISGAGKYGVIKASRELIADLKKSTQEQEMDADEREKSEKLFADKDKTYADKMKQMEQLLRDFRSARTIDEVKAASSGFADAE